MVVAAPKKSQGNQTPQPRLPALLHLCALESLHRTGSSRDAAIDQAVTVACVSQRLKALERELGQVLVIRSKTDARRFAFTREGRDLAVFLHGWLQELYQNIPEGAHIARRTRRVRTRGSAADL
ncbi:LysR family transcriptional regulator [Novosphingobium sp. Gsoil 351]|uniref:helix-turn-helix domain-containing protein n=1 Tax=Novosphingobium sp. Gsoil 351 TaxID=2675225 RepID=UPI00351BDB5C